MRMSITRFFLRCIVLALPMTALLPAQNWEVGADAGYAFFRQAPVTNGSVSGTTGFAPGLVAGALLGNSITHLIGGEVRYTLQLNDLQVKSGSTKATLSGQSHALHYDVLIHAAPRDSPIRPFFAAGAGVKFYRGTGSESAYQPLSNLVVLSHTNEAQPLISLGGGLKIAAGHRALIRFDFRDYMTPIPTSLLATPGSTKISGWMHDFVFLVGVSTTF
jgi:hypothetical protein